MRLRTQRVPTEEAESGPEPRDSPPTAATDNVMRSMMWGDRIATVGLATLGLALGVSQVVHGAYNEITWAPIALGALGLIVALVVAAHRPPPLALLVPVGGLWLWSLISSAWSDSTDAAHAAANRWLLYAAAIVVLSWALAGDRRRASVLLSSASVGVLGV